MPHAFIPAPNCASVEVIFLANGETIENVFHVQKGSPYTAANLIALRTIVDNWHLASYRNNQGTGSSLVRIRSKALDSTGSPMEDYALPASRPGTFGGTMLTNNVALCFKLSTGLSGRSFRGRWYVGGLTVSWIGADSNHTSGVASANLVTSLNLLLTNLAAGGHTLGVLSYRTGGAWRTTALFTPATGFVAVDLAFDSMRRRLAGRGRP